MVPSSSLATWHRYIRCPLHKRSCLVTVTGSASELEATALSCPADGSSSRAQDATVVCPVGASGPFPAVQVCNFTALLTDRRLVRVSDKKLVYSHIVGKAMSFFGECCDGNVVMPGCALRVPAAT